MELDSLTFEVRKLSNEFNPFLKVTPLQFRCMSITVVFKGSIAKNLDFEAFIGKLSDYLNVGSKVMKDHYNHFSIFEQNVEVQEALQTRQFAGSEEDLWATKRVMEPLVEREAIKTLVTASGRPIRLD